MSRFPLLTAVEETVQLTPHLTRVVVSGDDRAGFGAGEFTDHYVKLQLPPPGASYWKRTRTEEGWREDKAEWNRLAALDVAA